MPISAKLNQFLGRRSIQYQCLHHPRCGDLESAVRAAGGASELAIRGDVFIDASGVVQVVYPMQSDLDINAVNALLKRRLQPLTTAQVDRLFQDCEPGAHSPVGAAYGLVTVVDDSLWTQDAFLMASGCHTTLLQLDGRAFRLAFAGAMRGNIAIWRSESTANADSSDLSLEDVAQKLQKLNRLPPMPAVAVQVIGLINDLESTVGDLAKIIECDPSLAAQIMRYARSALFNYQGQINSVQDAVNRVLGYERVSHLAIGIAAAKAFQVPRTGMLGLDSYWRHALYCAHLCQAFAKSAPAKQNIQPGLAYLCGLLHNIGLLLVGHVFPPEFAMLNKLRESDSTQTMAQIEVQVFGMGGAQDLIAVGHGTIGGILMRLWQLPEEVVKAAGMHQLPGYEGDGSQYVALVQLANAVLKPLEIGDEFDEDDPASYLEAVGLTPEQFEHIREQALAATGELDALAQSFTG